MSTSGDFGACSACADGGPNGEAASRAAARAGIGMATGIVARGGKGSATLLPTGSSRQCQAKAAETSPATIHAARRAL